MDQKLFSLINGKWTSPVLDSFMATLSSFAAWVPLLVVTIVLVVIYGGFKAKAAIITVALIVVFMNNVVSATIKSLAHRARPREARENVRVLDLQPGKLQFLSVFKPVVVYLSPAPPPNPTGHSLPSSHTVNNFSAATVLAMFYRRRGWLYFIPATLVGYSRIYVGAHWPSDVLTSIFLAITCTLPLIAMLAWAWRKYGGKLLPAVYAKHPQWLGEVTA